MSCQNARSDVAIAKRMHGFFDVHVRIFVQVFGKWQVNGKWV